MKPIIIWGKHCLAILSREQIEHIGLNRELMQRLTMRNQMLAKRAELAVKDAKKLREQMSKMQSKFEKKIAAIKDAEKLNAPAR